jgi:hypothetical protein
MVYGCLCTMCKGRAWKLRDCGVSSPRPWSGPPLPQLLKKVRLNRPFGKAMASKAMRITDHSCGTDTWRGAIQGAQPPADPPHPERTIRCAPDFRIRSAPRSSRREHRYRRARSRMPPLGTLLRLGASATLELTGLRTPCVLIDRFRSGLKNRLQGKPAGPRFKAGVMAIVTEGGEVSPGDRIQAVLPAPPPSGPATALS